MAIVAGTSLAHVFRIASRSSCWRGVACDSTPRTASGVRDGAPPQRHCCCCESGGRRSHTAGIDVLLVRVVVEL